MDRKEQDGRSIEERRKAFEAKYRLDQEVSFKIGARRAKLLGRWAATLMGIQGAEADGYARAVVEADFGQPGHAAMVAKLQEDLSERGLKVTEAEIRAEMDRLEGVATGQILAELSKPGEPPVSG